MPVVLRQIALNICSENYREISWVYSVAKYLSYQHNKCLIWILACQGHLKNTVLACRINLWGIQTHMLQFLITWEQSECVINGASLCPTSTLHDFKDLSGVLAPLVFVSRNLFEIYMDSNCADKKKTSPISVLQAVSLCKVNQTQYLEHLSSMNNVQALFGNALQHGHYIGCAFRLSAH